MNFPLPDQPTILDKIVNQTWEDLSTRKKKISVSAFKDYALYHTPRRDFGGALRREAEVSIIAEVKKASPSKGIIREDFNPLKIAEQYTEAGAAALSVLTEPRFFQGSVDYLSEIRNRFEIPLLRKDFIIDFYQLEEARAYGADAVLLIVSVLEGNLLQELHHAAEEAGLQCLVECYSQEDFDRIDFSQVKILGVNNRDLRSFEVDVHRGISILEQSPDETIRVSESGLSTPDDIQLLLDNNIQSALIGEYFMRQPHPGDALKRILERL